MIECRKRNDGTQGAVMTFASSDILYDLRNYGYIEGSLLEGVASDHVRHTVQDIGESGNVDRVWRVLDLEHARCVDMLYPYTRHEITRDYLDNRLQERKVMGIVLQVPETFAQSTLNLLEKLVHEYLVSRVMEDWLSITYPEKSANWRDKGDRLGEDIRRCVGKRRGRVRLRQHFLG